MADGTCDECHQDERSILLELEAADRGKGGVRRVCSRCYKRVLESMHVGGPRELVPPPPATPRKRGCKPPEPERSQAKADVGSFTYTGGIQYVPDGDGYW